MPRHHHLDPHVFHNTRGAHSPAITIHPGDTITVETIDAHGYDANDTRRAPEPNPMSGPIALDGAEPGDALGVSIVDIALTRNTGWTRSSLAHNVVDPAYVPTLPDRAKSTWSIDRTTRRVSPQDPPASLAGWSLPCDPMIGCFGVAPAGGEAISTATSGPHGGNMDWRGFKPGTTVWFPVAVPGALFFLGDGHALQGDGEISGTGVETSCLMTVTLSLRKRWPIAWPRGEDGNGRFTVGNARPLDQALQHATTEMSRWLAEDGHDGVAISHILGQAVRYEIANVYDPAYTVICRLPAGII